MKDKSYQDMVGEQPGGDESAEENVLLPKPGDSYYAASRPSNRALLRLWVVIMREFKSGEPYRFYQYVHLDSDCTIRFADNGQTLTLRFSGINPVEIKVHGRNLLQIADYISLHRIAVIREADRDFGQGNEPIITKIDILPIVKEPME
jgi:hypothetical protein